MQSCCYAGLLFAKWATCKNKQPLNELLQHIVKFQYVTKNSIKINPLTKLMRLEANPVTKTMLHETSPDPYIMWNEAGQQDNVA